MFVKTSAQAFWYVSVPIYTYIYNIVALLEIEIERYNSFYIFAAIWVRVSMKDSCILSQRFVHSHSHHTHTLTSLGACACTGYVHTNKNTLPVHTHTHTHTHSHHLGVCARTGYVHTNKNTLPIHTHTHTHTHHVQPSFPSSSLPLLYTHIHPIVCQWWNT